MTNVELESIAIQWFNRDLKERSTGEDFTEVAVWSIRSALEAAFAAGQASK
jgi:hypothetical protein